MVAEDALGWWYRLHSELDHNGLFQSGRVQLSFNSILRRPSLLNRKTLRDGAGTRWENVCYKRGEQPMSNDTARLGSSGLPALLA